MNTERLMLAGAIGLLSLALGISEFARLRQSGESAKLEERVALAEADASAALRAVIEPTILTEADKSVYMVTRNGKHHGSAFVIDRERGILVTAAHVAEHLDFDVEEPDYAIVNRHTGKPVRIRAIKIHDGFHAYRRLVERYEPVNPSSRLASPGFVKIYDLAHDGALLFVEHIDEKTGENILGPDLPVASDQSLQALKPGDPIAILGFPVDTMTDNLAENSASSRVERGVVANMIAPIDILENANDVVTQFLIVHRMAMAPGNSGGPVLNAAGEIVGINSHGTSSNFSNGDKIAQRADIIHDLTTIYREQDMLERVYFPAWQERLKKWPRAADIIPSAIYAANNLSGDARENLKSLYETTLADLEPADKNSFKANTQRIKFSPPQREFILFADDLLPEDDEEAEKDRAQRIKKRPQSSEARPTFVIQKTGQYAETSLSLSRYKNHAVFAYDYSMEWGSQGSCRLEILHRRHGDDKLRTTRDGRLEIVNINADPKREGSSRFDFIIRRQPCDRRSDDFTFGVVTWDRDKDQDKTPPPAPTAALRNVQTVAWQARENVAKLVDCSLAKLGAEKDCHRTIKIQNLTMQEK